MKIAIYARTAAQRPDTDPFSIPGQVAQVQDWAATHDHQIAGIYADPARSGNDKERPELRRMMTDAVSSERSFAVVVVCNFSRFFRDAFQYESHVRVLQHVGVSIISISQPTSSGDNAETVRGFIDLMDAYARRKNHKK